MEHFFEFMIAFDAILAAVSRHHIYEKLRELTTSQKVWRLLSVTTFSPLPYGIWFSGGLCGKPTHLTHLQRVEGAVLAN